MENASDLLHVNDKNFAAEVLNSEVPVLVDFWATWCGPCRSISPIVEELATEFTGRVKITKLNVDENPAIPSQYGVRGILVLWILGNCDLFGIWDLVIGAWSTMKKIQQSWWKYLTIVSLSLGLSFSLSNCAKERPPGQALAPEFKLAT